MLHVLFDFAICLHHYLLVCFSLLLCCCFVCICLMLAMLLYFPISSSIWPYFAVCCFVLLSVFEVA